MHRPLLFLIYLTSAQLYSQSASTLLGARAAGMGYASATVQDEWSFFNNIAGLAGIKEKAFAATYEVRPNLPSANRLGALFAMPFSFGSTGFGVFKFGNDVYSEQIIALGYANQIGKTSLGARISYIQYKAEGYGTHGALGINVGGITQITPQIAVGAWIQNINQPKIDFADKEKAPVKLLLALSFKASEKFFVVTELEKDVLYKTLWKTGMEYAVHKKFFARAGFNIQPNSFFIGVGYNGARIKIDYALQSFTQIGASHQASASYRIGKKPKEK
jgi:hypothetical protein